MPSWKDDIMYIWDSPWDFDTYHIYGSSEDSEKTGYPGILVTHKLWTYTVKPVLIGHSKIDKTKVLKTNGRLMKVESTKQRSDKW